MIYLYFFLKFKTQFRKTKPDIIQKIDELLYRAISEAGGKVTSERVMISASFKEDNIGFYLDIFILIEKIKNIIESYNEFFGYSLIVTSEIPSSPELLSRYLANQNGIFINAKAAKKLIPYLSFEKPSEWLSGAKRRKYGAGSFYRVKELKVFKKTIKNDLNIQKEVLHALDQEKGKSKLILGPPYSQMKSGLSKYCQKINGDFPSLSVCFGSVGLGALVDVWSQKIRSLAQGVPTDDIDNLWELLFRDRIRDEVSDYIIRSLKKYLILVFDFYLNAARKRKCTPVITIENIHLAGSKVTSVLLDALEEINYENKKKLMLLGICDNDIPEDRLKLWGPLFNNVIKLDILKNTNIFFPKLSTDLWEIIYAVSLFGRYFSPELFGRLFEEEGINPAMITRAFSILHTLEITNEKDEPSPVNRHLEDYAKKLLGDRHLKVKKLVCSRLLSWAARRNINPCFKLLAIIASLEGEKQIDDILLLKSFLSDIVNNTVTGIEAAIKSGFFDELTAERSEAVKYIYKTSNALYSGNEEEIEKIFLTTFINIANAHPAGAAGSGFSPVLKAQILVNLSAYHLGRHDFKEARDKAKEAILLGQNKNIYCLPQAYRMFSLVCLSKKQSSETIEYLGFALANAEKAGNFDELAISAYYAAAAQFLYGDIYKAHFLAQKSIEQSLSSGHPDWADRSRFLEGRLEFELGHYRKAHDIFDDLRKNPYGCRKEEKDNVLAAWAYRCKIYLNDPAALKPSGCHDSDLFEIEAAYLSGDYQRAVELSSSVTNPFSKDNFLYTEQADWRSGFAQCEHLFFSEGEIEDRMKCLFQSLAQSCISKENAEAAMHDMQKILRDDKLCEMDPFDAIYFYAKYRIIEQTGASLVDLSTVVSMAFKRLQRRAGRIEDAETRRKYMTGSRWNRELSLLAKEYKLI